MLGRRDVGRLLAGTVVLGAGMGARAAAAADKVVRVGLNFSLTGSDAESAKRMVDGALMAIDAANAANDMDGWKIDPMVLDDGTATAGQYDPAQAATNARRMVSDRSVVAAVGPQMSGAGKAMAPILSQGDLAIITPSSTNPDLTDPKFAAQYRPAGKAIYFRTVTTDAFQGPNMANFFAETLGAKKIFVLDDSGAYGVGMADAFQAQAAKKGVTVLGRDRLDPKAADYSAVLTRIKSLGADSLYYGGVGQAGIKLAKQGYDIIPDVKKGGGDGMVGADLLSGAGFPAIQGWYATIASPHLLDDPQVSSFVTAFRAKYGVAPEDYSITAYDAAQVIVAAVRSVAKSGKDVTRDAVRDAIASDTVPTLQGDVAFDPNGDIRSKVVSVFQILKDDKYPLDDVAKQYHYVGVAPAS